MTQKAAVLPSPSEDFSQSYFRQWVIFFLLMAGVAAFYWHETHLNRSRPVPAPTTSPEMRNWFYLLRMPEVQIHSDIRSSQKQMSKWIEALEKEGFHFLLLSEVLSDIQNGIALPEKTAVILFDPGFRRTSDTYKPVLTRMNVPAVWLTNGKAIELKDKRYVSQHVVSVMRESGLWDVGFYSPDAPVSVQTKDHHTFVLGARSPWKQDAGHFALNRGPLGEPLDRLNVNAKWTEEDLVNRLLVERPVQGPTILSLQQIQGRNWGIGMDIDSTRDTRFTLRAPADKRSGSFYWLGTLGLNDVHLRIEVKSLIGEMRILLRSDPVTGEDVSVVLGRGKVAVEQTRNFKAETLATVPCPDITPNIPFTALLAIKGRELAVAVNDHPLVALDSLSLPTSNKGMIRLVVQDSLTGVGEARSVRMICTPLQKK